VESLLSTISDSLKDDSGIQRTVFKRSIVDVAFQFHALPQKQNSPDARAVCLVIRHHDDIKLGNFQRAIHVSLQPPGDHAGDTLHERYLRVQILSAPYVDDIGFVVETLHIDQRDSQLISGHQGSGFEMGPYHCIIRVNELLSYRHGREDRV